jgi:peptidyl-prolyl cis-trans isomerase-like 4
MSVILETNLGDITVDLYVDRAGKASRNFINLCKMKFYNNALFYELQKDYAVSIKTKVPPTSFYKELNPSSNNRYFEDEIHPDMKHDKFGLLSTNNKGPNMNDSEFFITLSD